MNGIIRHLYKALEKKQRSTVTSSIRFRLLQHEYFKICLVTRFITYLFLQAYNKSVNRISPKNLQYPPPRCQTFNIVSKYTNTPGSMYYNQLLIESNLGFENSSIFSTLKCGKCVSLAK